MTTTDSALFEHMTSAAAVAADIRAANEHGEHIIVRAADHGDALLAVKAGFTGNRHDSLSYRQVVLEAESGAHGSHLADEDAALAQLREASEGAQILEIIVTVRAGYGLSDLHLIPVLSGLARQLRVVADEAAELYLSNSSVVWIIDDQPQSR